MGIFLSFPFSGYNDLENGFESIVLKFFSFGDNGVKNPVQSSSFHGHDSKPTILQLLVTGKMTIEGLVSYKTRQSETPFLKETPLLEEKKSKVLVNQSPKSDNLTEKITQLPHWDAYNPKHEAAIKLQKVYKSFRTRRKLADCAVLVEQSWWKLLDFAELKHSSISFFDVEKHETAISRWSRARTRAAKVGKGLSKNGKAQKLALQHWLEAIDPRHRYGHNLHLYYDKWLHSQSKEPFFYWLDIGEGKEVNLVEKCPRSKLHQQCIKYLGPMERKAYEVVLENGMLFYQQTGELIDTTEPKGAKWIFVLSTSFILYVGKKKKGSFQHSSFLAGGATSAAGRLVVEKGILKAVWPHSGHYRPTPENFQVLLSFLRRNNIDLTNVKMDPVVEEEEEGSLRKQRNVFLRRNSSEEDLTEKDDLEKTNLIEGETLAAMVQPNSRPPRSLTGKLTDLTIPNKVDLFQRFEDENQAVDSSINRFEAESSLDGYDTSEESVACDQDHMLLKQNLSDEEDKEAIEETIPEEVILQRINSHKGMKSFQLGKQLSCNWTTGAGPRIGCLRDYPYELQSRALEKLNLSPRSASFLRSVSTPASYSGETLAAIVSPVPEKTQHLLRRNTRHSIAPLSPLCKGTSVNATPKS
ncbi:IQ domain-containing protein IQM2-like [Cornus florida]|uniref:IQ domain-containing protein IQM2-like n=1 Tax=Cornus florida TaxID=4283 RepID=UPI00289ECE73|nr:IQ domain-containing protein IQM2-like [Cornus florida]